MDIISYIEANSKYYAHKNTFYIRKNIFILSNHNVEDKHLGDLSDKLSKYKVVLYKLSDGRLMIYRMSYPTQRYKLDLNKGYKRLRFDNRSKAYINYFIELAGLNRQPKILYKSFETNVNALKQFKTETVVDYSTTSQLPLGKWVGRYSQELTYTLVGTYPSERKSARSEEMITQQAEENLKNFTKFMDDGNDYCTPEHINNLIELRLSVNPVKNKVPLSTLEKKQTNVITTRFKED